MWIDIVFLVVSLVVILVGANLLTDGSAAVARRFGLSDLVVGLTVVAFGTSTPELVVSIMAAINGNAPLAVGNVVGSNIFNILVIIGLTAAVMPISIKRTIITREIPMVIMSSFILLVLGAQTLLGGSSNTISRAEGIFLLIFFALFMRYTLNEAKGGTSGEETQDKPAEAKPSGMAKNIVLIIAGLAGLVWGGNKFVESASGIARAIGVSDAVIGLTVVAAGTSLPELAASIVAAVKKMPGMAVGNVIGSNIFNVLFVLGLSSVVSPLPFGDINLTDLLVLMGASLLFWFFGWAFKTRTITRWEGVLMFACYVGYTAYLISQI